MTENHSAAELDSFHLLIEGLKLNGIDTTRRLRASGAAYAQVPVLGLTANVHPRDLDQFLLAGVDALALRQPHIYREPDDQAQRRHQAVGGQVEFAPGGAEIGDEKRRGHPGRWRR